MKVHIYTKDGKVTSVRANFPKGLTEEDIKNLLESYNESHKEDGMVCHLLDLDPLMSEVFKFFLGEKEYKIQYEMSDIYESLEESWKFIRDLRDDLNNMKDDLDNTMDTIEAALNDLKKLKDEN